MLCVSHVFLCRVQCATHSPISWRHCSSAWNKSYIKKCWERSCPCPDEFHYRGEINNMVFFGEVTMYEIVYHSKRRRWEKKCYMLMNVFFVSVWSGMCIYLKNPSSLIFFVHWLYLSMISIINILSIHRFLNFLYPSQSRTHKLIRLEGLNQPTNDSDAFVTTNQIVALLLMHL